MVTMKKLRVFMAWRKLKLFKYRHIISIITIFCGILSIFKLYHTYFYTLTHCTYSAQNINDPGNYVSEFYLKYLHITRRSRVSILSE